MSLLAHLRDEAPVQKLYRWVTLLPEDEALDLPAMKMYLEFMAQETLNGVMKPFLKKSEKVQETDEKRFRRSVAKHCWSDWSGVTFDNLCRASAWVLQRKDALKERFKDVPEEGLEFTIEDAQWLAEKLDVPIFNAALNEATDLDKYALAAIEEEKKD